MSVGAEKFLLNTKSPLEVKNTFEVGTFLLATKLFLEYVNMI